MYFGGRNSQILSVDERTFSRQPPERVTEGLDAISALSARRSYLWCGLSSGQMAIWNVQVSLYCSIFLSTLLYMYIRACYLRFLEDGYTFYSAFVYGVMCISITCFYTLYDRLETKNLQEVRCSFW